MKDDQNRVTIALWNMLKPYIQYDAKDGMTPTFGFIVDKFRTQYGVYISATPASNDDIIVYRYRYEVFKIEGNNIRDQWTGTEQAYYVAMRKAIQKALEFITK